MERSTRLFVALGAVSFFHVVTAVLLVVGYVNGFTTTRIVLTAGSFFGLVISYAFKKSLNARVERKVGCFSSFR